ncbi:uncharacterized protein EI97DRAFT_440496 [Westerdykella ornata]|uniref:Uncharacterized protein n=1 Tax=Westerdykella ornata TaxID=318751 RepID=A0A6A6JQT9_WESOR|nr:uncharacterized protein EI97DRAFT_440496 [Westerdykella ornata]KAF2279010.1 hypothetical protein EI97DRAFT_440496 [Westerdykella ornata]
MGGGEDVKIHDSPASPPSSPTPSPSGTQNGTTEAIPLKKTGEMMLGFALAIVFLVIFCIIIHLLLKQHRQRYPNGRPKKKKMKKPKDTDLEKGTVELHSVDRKVFEAASTQVVLCELPEDAPPRHELDAGYVLPVSPLERTLTGTTGVTGTTVSDMESNREPLVSPAEPLPAQHLAVYWQTR